jgi:hypothetical protein
VSGKLSQDIIYQFKDTFEDNCIQLMLEAYYSLLASGRKVNEETENNITAQLVGFMKVNPKRSDLQISLERENYLDSDEIYEGLVDADTSPRIDIKYSTWNSSTEIEYFMEAKNLAEKDWQKITTKAIVDAHKLRKRYIETGINNFASGKYLNGCLLGYVLEGDNLKIVELINQSLKKEKRDLEVLKKLKKYSFDYYYVSNHKQSKSFILKHFLLNLGS